MSSRDGRSAGGSCIASYVVVYILPESTSADGIVATEHLHFRIKQEEIDCKQNTPVSWIKVRRCADNIYRKDKFIVSR